MFPSAVLFALGGALLVADGVPTLDIEAGCRAAAKMGDSLSLDESLRQCLSDERSARNELDKQWSQFPPALRQRCCHHRDRRRPQLRRSSRVPANGGRCSADGKALEPCH